MGTFDVLLLEIVLFLIIEYIGILLDIKVMQWEEVSSHSNEQRDIGFSEF